MIDVRYHDVEEYCGACLDVQLPAGSDMAILLHGYAVPDHDVRPYSGLAGGQLHDFHAATGPYEYIAPDGYVLRSPEKRVAHDAALSARTQPPPIDVAGLPLDAKQVQILQFSRKRLIPEVPQASRHAARLRLLADAASWRDSFIMPSMTAGKATGKALRRTDQSQRRITQNCVKSRTVGPNAGALTLKNVLISGGAGFIGSHLTADLLSRGYKVTVLDNLSAQVHGQDRTIGSTAPGLSFVQGDVRLREDWLEALTGQQVVVHLAAETGTGQSMYQIERYMDVNVRGTAALLDILTNEAPSIEKILLASSRAIYGEGKYACRDHGTVYPGPRIAAQLSAGDFAVKCPMCHAPATAVATDEDSKLHATSVYGISKQTQEQMFMTVGRALGIPAVALRYQNVYGPGQSLRNPYTGILSIFSTRLRNGLPVSIFEDGKETRDFVFIDDVVEATRSAIEQEAANFEVFNVGSGVQTDVLTVAHSLRDALARTGDIEVSGNFRIGDIRHNFADVSKIAAHVGFRPRIHFAEGIRRFAAWVSSQPVPTDLFDRSIEEMRRRGLYK